MTAEQFGPVMIGAARPGLGEARIGISGWRYVPWRTVFYPKGLPQRRELEFVSGRMNSVEINGSFYALQTPASYTRWAAEVPDNFLFSVKGGRYITHILRLKNAEKALPNFFASGILALGQKLGPVLWQVPPNLAYDRPTLDAFLSVLPRTTTEAVKFARGHDDRMEGRSWLKTDADRPIRYALEVRHPSFESDDFVRLAREHDVAIVVSDSAGRFPQMFEVTADCMYVRLHGAEELYVSGYPEDQLQTWAARVHGWRTGASTDGRPRDVYVYCDNDAKVRAPFDAMRLASIVADLAG